MKRNIVVRVLSSTVILGMLLLPTSSLAAADAAAASTSRSSSVSTAPAVNHFALNLVVDGNQQKLSAPIIKENGVTYAPIKELSDALKLTYSIVDSTQTVITKKGNITTSFKLGQKEALVNGKKVKLDGAAFKKNNVLYTPIRALAEIYYAEVSWNSAKNAITIITAEYAIEQEPQDWEEVQQSRPKLSAKEIADIYDESVVMIMTNNSQGSGVVIDSNLIVTNYHVMKDVSTATAYSIYGDEYKIKGVVASDKKADLAILLTEDSDMDLMPAELAYGFNMNKGDKVFALGSPLGVQNTISEGLVSNVFYEDGARLIQMSAPIDHGSSGGALFDEYGEVVGITSSGYPNTQADLNFAVSGYHAIVLYLGITENDLKKAAYLKHTLPASLEGKPLSELEAILKEHYASVNTSHGTAKFSNWQAQRDHEGWIVLTADIDPLFYLYYGSAAKEELKLWSIQLGHELHRMLPKDTIQMKIYFERSYGFKPRGLADQEVASQSNETWKVRYSVIDMQLKDQMYIQMR